jgi:hypothetical protein
MREKINDLKDIHDTLQVLSDVVSTAFHRGKNLSHVAFEVGKAIQGMEEEFDRLEEVIDDIDVVDTKIDDLLEDSFKRIRDELNHETNDDLLNCYDKINNS